MMHASTLLCRPFGWGGSPLCTHLLTTTTSLSPKKIRLSEQALVLSASEIKGTWMVRPGTESEGPNRQGQRQKTVTTKAK